MSVYVSVMIHYSSNMGDSRYNERYHHVKCQVCSNMKMAFFLKLSYSKVRAISNYLGRGGHLQLIPTLCAMFCILSITCLLTRKVLHLSNYYSRLTHVLNVE